jgi:hypothetical protein
MADEKSENRDVSGMHAGAKCKSPEDYDDERHESTVDQVQVCGHALDGGVRIRY